MPGFLGRAKHRQNMTYKKLRLRTIGKVIIETNFGPDLALLPPRASSVTIPKPDKLYGNPP